MKLKFNYLNLSSQAQNVIHSKISAHLPWEAVKQKTTTNKKTLPPCKKWAKLPVLFKCINIFTANKFYISETVDRKKKNQKTHHTWWVRHGVPLSAPARNIKCLAIWSPADLESQVCPSFGKKMQWYYQVKRTSLAITPEAINCYCK